MPHGFNTGYEKMPVDREFCWIAEDSGGTIWGIFLAAPCHGAMFIVRVCVAKDAPRFVTALMLRQFVRDSEARGYKGYFTFVNPTNEVERRLIAICRHAKGGQIPQLHVALVGRFAEAMRY